MEGKAKEINEDVQGNTLSQFIICEEKGTKN